MSHTQQSRAQLFACLTSRKVGQFLPSRCKLPDRNHLCSSAISRSVAELWLVGCLFTYQLFVLPYESKALLIIMSSSVSLEAMFIWQLFADANFVEQQSCSTLNHPKISTQNLFIRNRSIIYQNINLICMITYYKTFRPFYAKVSNHPRRYLHYIHQLTVSHQYSRMLAVSCDFTADCTMNARKELNRVTLKIWGRAQLEAARVCCYALSICYYAAVPRKESRRRQRSDMK